MSIIRRSRSEQPPIPLVLEFPLLKGRYTLEAEVGSGSFGRTYRARDKRLGRLVAVKQAHEDERSCQMLQRVSGIALPSHFGPDDECNAGQPPPGAGGRSHRCISQTFSHSGHPYSSCPVYPCFAWSTLSIHESFPSYSFAKGSGRDFLQRSRK
jgi:serine/threonine protein kinase